MGDAIHDGITPAAAHADEFFTLEPDPLLAHGAGQNFEQLSADFLPYQISTSFTFVNN